MISQKIVNAAFKHAQEISETLLMPSWFHVELSFNKGQELAKNHHANSQIIALGTLFMDIKLGDAIAENKQMEHISMSESWAKYWLKKQPKITPAEIDNICACIRQHHGSAEFATIEAEICCNADCYRFCSVEGVIGGMHLGRKMPVPELIKLYRFKADEKWHALTLKSCRQELNDQYQLICHFLDNYLKHYHDQV